MTVAIKGEYILNGHGDGPIGHFLGGRRFDPGILRPFIETDPNSPDRGRPCAEIMVQNVHTGKWDKKKYQTKELEARGIYSPVFNATTLTRDSWIQIDRAVERATRQPLTAWSDLRRANTIGGFDAWAKMSFEYTAVTDAGEVVKDMDATSPGRDDTPLAIIRSIPLPVIHGDFAYPQRLLDSVRSSGMPLDTEMVEQITRRLWESVERTLIGTETGVTWAGRTTGPWPHTGNSTEYGYTNFPYRVTKTNLTAPTGSNPQVVMQDVMAMIETMNGNGYFGPFILYHSTPYTVYLNDDYFRSGSTSAVRTLRDRVMDINGISDIRRLNYLTSGYQLILVDYGTSQFQAINGMMPKTVQWAERGGMIQKFMIMAIQVALLRSPYNGVSAIVHGTTS